jgi:manganese/zinc/iron transport system substrate-binding protein
MRLNLNYRSLSATLQAPIALAGLMLASLVAACGSSSSSTAAPLIVATTGHIHDALLTLVKGTDIELKLLCGPGVDPHSYGASTKDVLAMERAQAIVFNGFHLEAQLGDVLARESLAVKAWAMASAFPEEERLDWTEDGTPEGEVDPDAPFDPHIWNHLPGWSACVAELTAHLTELFPEHAELLATNGADYRAQITEAHEWAQEQLQLIPESQRVLVSGHDAFQYFARQYGWETVAVLGVGNDPEADIKTMQSVSGFVVERKVPVIFLESITNPKVTKALEEACAGRGWAVRIADVPLYSDDLGEAPPVNTYLGAFRTNVETIIQAMRAS